MRVDIGCGGLVGLVVLLAVAGALVGGGETTLAPNQAEKAGGSPDRAREQERELQEGEQEAEEARQEAEAAKEEAAQAKEEAEEAEAARAQAENEPAPAPEGSRTGAPADEGNSGTVTIRITGTAGETFSGSYGNIDTTRTVDGTVPASYRQEVDTGFLAMDTVTAVFQKMGAGQGRLKVDIIQDGEVVKSQNTTAEYGVATVNWVPGE